MTLYSQDLAHCAVDGVTIQNKSSEMNDKENILNFVKRKIQGDNNTLPGCKKLKIEVVNCESKEMSLYINILKDVE